MVSTAAPRRWLRVSFRIGSSLRIMVDAMITLDLLLIANVVISSFFTRGSGFVDEFNGEVIDTAHMPFQKTAVSQTGVSVVHIIYTRSPTPES